MWRENNFQSSYSGTCWVVRTGFCVSWTVVGFNVDSMVAVIRRVFKTTTTTINNQTRRLKLLIILALLKASSRHRLVRPVVGTYRWSAVSYFDGVLRVDGGMRRAVGVRAPAPESWLTPNDDVRLSAVDGQRIHETLWMRHIHTEILLHNLFSAESVCLKLPLIFRFD